MKPMSLQCDRMARVAAQYCAMIREFEDAGPDETWLQDMGKLLPRLHVAVIDLATPDEDHHKYSLPDDDQRCELYLRIHERLQGEPGLWTGWSVPGQHQRVCDCLADDFTDMYFDISRGLEILQASPNAPEAAECDWLCSFYLHWGQHLLDAEYWLRAMAGRSGVAETSGHLAWSYEDQDHYRE